MLVHPVLAGLKSVLCGYHEHEREGPGQDPNYCYAVWMRHFMLARQNGLNQVPESVAELGPGDSLGAGIAALLCGVRRYYALDVLKYGSMERNLALVEKIAQLVRRGANVPDCRAFPELRPPLESYRFPSELLAEVNDTTIAKRTEQICRAIKGEPSPISIKYVVPWYDSEVMRSATVDLVFSQAVLEHVNDLSYTYTTIHERLRPGGFSSHQVDFRSHGLTREWYGHWTCSDFTWRLIVGRRPYLLNRHGLSDHALALSNAGFEILHCIPERCSSGIGRQQLEKRFAHFDDGDLTCCSAYILSRRM